MTDENAIDNDPLSALVGDLADEYLDRLERGEQPDPAEYAARHPAAADLIARVLAIVRLAPTPVPAAAPVVRPADPVPRVLGDFRIVREVGRGGMGVVYEAEQLGLGRRVALKVLPFAALTDSRLVQRFQNEARAAAALDHPHVVKVHAVGEAGGIHFLAMQFIDGRPLSDLIRERRTGAATPKLVVGPDAPTATQTAPGAATATDGSPVTGQRTKPVRGDAAYFRQVATWGVQAAGALEHAHSMGVVHRDVKPGNLLLDSSGIVWVADFGLAKLAASDLGLTGTGDVLGTPRYMSPEQAGAKHGLVDHRTDVYALGATLYELLTSLPAVDGKDKAEILRKIALDEVVPPRKLDRGIPRDLETVVLKCMAKESGERYPSAGEVAADLRRFLADEPIRAQRPTIRQRTGRWTRKHPRTVATVVLLAIATVAGASVWDRRRTADRLATAAAESAARELVAEADVLWREGRPREALAVGRRAADRLPETASVEARERVAGLTADLGLVCRLEDARLAQVARRPGSDLAFANTAAVPLYDEAFRTYGIDVRAEAEAAVEAALQKSAARAEVVAALVDWARVAATPEEKARLERLAAALDDNGSGPISRARRAAAAGNEAELARIAAEATANPPPPAVLERLALVLSGLIRADDLVRLLRAGHTHSSADLWVNVRLAQVLTAAGRPAEAVEHYRGALAVRPRAPTLWNNLASSLNQARRFAEAEEAAGRAIGLDPAAAPAHYNLGTALYGQWRYAAAEAASRRAVELLPDAHAHYLLGVCLVAQDKHSEAEAALARSVALDGEFAAARYNHSVALSRLQRLPEAEAEARRAIALAPRDAAAQFQFAQILQKQERWAEAEAGYRRVVALRPSSVEAQGHHGILVRPPFAEAHANLGILLQRQEKWAEAEAAYRQAIAADPALREVHDNLGVLVGRQGRMDESRAAHARAVEIDPQSVTSWFMLASRLLALEKPAEAVAALQRVVELDPRHAQAHYMLGNTRKRLGDLPGAETALRAATVARPDFAEAHCNLGRLLLPRGAFREGLAALERGHDLGSRRKTWKYASAQWVAEARGLVALDDRLTAVLAGTAEPTGTDDLLNLAGLCLTHRGRPAAAVRFYASAFAADPKLLNALHGYRYNAACAAARAGGEDARTLPEADRAGHRQQALGWLTAELAGWQKCAVLPPARYAIRAATAYWQKDPDLAGVRDPAALDWLPEAERRAWERFWADAATVLSPNPAADAPREAGPRPREIRPKF